MKVFILFLLLAVPFLVNAQSIRIPDPAFRDKLIALGYDTNDNGKLEVSEVKDIKELSLTESNIINVEGINSFVNLEELNLNRNKIAKVDVSNLKKLKGLYVSDNPLTEINVTGLTQLVNLFLANHGGQYGNLRSFLRELDVSTLTNLEELRCDRNMLTKLDVSGLNKLERLTCESNLLESVVLNKAPNLNYVDLKKNPIAVTIDIRGLVNLEYFNCKDCQLIYLNMSGTIKLKELEW